ncbi:hypothetical protein UFOVP899_29 [uncultured Caudovirales phage]|uniref:K1 capsule-specific polysaccharide lyase C-terminal domain-containing protein n=2 Tax=uncultured Caudovirales phage TaxID=2100421 RepID=A0A6J5RTM7_9CAUD|nr:hypothetical protein UFOVP899_29 [uncultured Caudovirales phage]CAB4176414.1 hypothetical protein UFOVP987_28 [uncultured Caudovirales phage]CAB4180822.1 hypothetical protein UFOVP1074_9 [uncultured Caudovirales phage]CAB4197526.1 hypothetical protein UFOVP1310_6 [uncultured Caudovirales phage]CAB5227612.1 hypothetical protein UFOVP1521_66 [uncultured Caudovirales phage]
MTFSFNNPYSLFPTSPSQYGYEEINLIGNSTFAWPENNSDSQFIIAQQMYVSTDNIANQFIFPPANLVGTGRTFQIFNFGSLEFTIYDNDGISLATIDPGQLYQCTVTDNNSVAGVWATLLLGIGASGADANALAGYGLSSLTNSKINTNLPETVITSAYTIQPSDRGTILSYTGGTNNIILPSPVDGFIVGVINNSTVGGLLTLQPPFGYTINNASNLSLAPGDSTFITGGANYNAIGIGRLNFGIDSLLELDVSASINITLTTAQSNNNIIIFSGALSNNINVFFTPVQVNKYDIYNNTTGGFNITVSTFSGVNIYLLKDQERYAYFTDTSELYNVPSNVGASNLASFWLSSSNPSLPNQVNLGSLQNGLVGINVALSTATPYTIPIYNNLSSNNFFLGANSVPSPLPTGTSNTAVGINTGSVISIGVQNTAFGSYALNSNTTGSGNTAVGVNSGASYDDNNECIFIGSNSDSSVGNLINAIAIGSGAQVTASNTMILGAPGTAVAVNSIDNLVVTANSAANGTVGSVQLNGITNVTVNTTACKTTSRVFLTPITNALPLNNSLATVNTIANGSFNVVGALVADDSFVQWFIVNPV